MMERYGRPHRASKYLPNFPEKPRRKTARLLQPDALYSGTPVSTPNEPSLEPELNLASLSGPQIVSALSVEPKTRDTAVHGASRSWLEYPARAQTVVLSRQ